ncbi:MAG: hypothetical protein U5K69_05545 [Balneolaceae bacterium]|nr:hypothetical protein [Balneolaceae bacterium]
MSKKLKYIFAGLLLLVVGLFAYHFYAANKAEQTINETIQQITSKSATGVSINYTFVEVSPFSGDILFSDVNIIRDVDLQRASTARFDLSYWDFLNFIVWGTESGLEQVQTGILEIQNFSYTNRSSYVELKVDSLHVDYAGNLWNLIVLGTTQRPAEIQHHIRASGKQFRYYHPEEGIGSIRSDSLQMEVHFGKTSFQSDSLYNSFDIKNIIWGPPPSIREKYEFFIQGFGYQTDSIPFRRAEVIFRYDQLENQVKFEEITLNSELFTVSSQGNILVDPLQFSHSQLYDFSIRIQEMSPRFQNFLQQTQNLMGFKIPGSADQIQLKLKGTLDEPQVIFGK